MLWPRWDVSLFHSVNNISSPMLTSFMRFITNVDNWIPFLLVYILLLLWWGRTRPNRVEKGKWKGAFAARNPRIVLLCLILAASASDQICYHLKHNVHRPRPCFEEELEGTVNYRGDVHGNRSFPSAHSANSAALASITAYAYPPLAPYAAAVALVVGFSRVYLGVHYPLDVLTGWSIGLLAASLVWLLLRRYARRPGMIGFTNRFKCRQPVSREKPSPPWMPVVMNSLDGYTAEGLFRREADELAVMVHGLHGSMQGLVEPGNILAEMGFSVLIVPLRGHDGHPCPVTGGGPPEVMDLAGALMYAKEELGFERGGTIVYGCSMGGAVAMKTAGLLTEPVAGVIVHGGYENFMDSARRRLGAFRTFLMKLFLPSGVSASLKDFFPVEYAAGCRETAFMYITGQRDRIAAPKTAERMASATGGASTILLNTGHPVWQKGRWKRAQIKAAFESAIEYIRSGKAVPKMIGDDGEKYSDHRDRTTETESGK